VLIAFRVKNYRSISDEQEISFLRSARMRSSSVGAVEAGWEPSVTTVAALYGGNASGKSNILNALAFMASAVADSHSDWKPEREIPYHPFRLNSRWVNEPSWFEVDIRLGSGLRLQYGFEHDRKRFLREWLYAYPNGRRQTWFERDHLNKDGEEWYFGKALGGPNRLVADTTRPNSLFLSAAATSQHKRLSRVYRWFTANLGLADSTNREDRMRFTVRRLDEDPDTASVVTGLLKHADLGICDIAVRRRESSDEEREQVLKVARSVVTDREIGPDDELVERILAQIGTSVELVHKCADGESVTLPFDAESLGTQSLVALAGPVLDSLAKGTTLLVDEVDTSLHPRLVAEIVRLYKSPASNPRQAQLIFSTHDTSLLGGLIGEEPILDRDQIWFVKKDGSGRSELYPLSDFSPRKLENLERGYLQGRYGAVPFVEDMSVVLRDSDLAASGAEG
jgi:AAA15 family ATPase/GTPase